MSQLDGKRNGNGLGGPAGGVGVAETRRRRASVTLREGTDARGAQTIGDLMDPANKSLADALKIAYRLMQLLIVVMVCVFAFSGYQQVGASEAGVRVTLGKISARGLEPGAHMSWPQPIGDIIRVPTNDQRVELKKDFYPNLTDAEEKNIAEKGVQILADGGRNQMDPDTDGAMVSADGYLVHARWQVTYQRAEPIQALEKIARDSDGPDGDRVERQIVTAAVRRGIVHAAAMTPIDQILANQPDVANNRPRFSEVARDEAQKMLDRMDLGLKLKQFDMSGQIPPRFVMKDFDAVQTSLASANKQREDAQSDAGQKLRRTAGEGATVLLEQIDRYGQQLASGKKDEAAATLKTIQDLMQRKPVRIDGKDVPVSVSGEVSTMLAEAEQYRTGVVQKAAGDAAAYSASLQAFRANPSVYLTTEWKNAYQVFAGRNNLQTLILPPGAAELIVMINQDPSLAKEMERILAEDEATKAQEKRKLEREREIYKTKMQGTSIEGI